MEEYSQVVLEEQVLPLLPQPVDFVVELRELIPHFLLQLLYLSEQPRESREVHVSQLLPFDNAREVMLCVPNQLHPRSLVLPQSHYHPKRQILHALTKPYFRIFRIIILQQLLSQLYALLQLCSREDILYSLFQLLEALFDSFIVLLVIGEGLFQGW